MSATSSTGTGGGTHAVLPEIPIFALMPPEVRTLVVASLEPVAFGFGELIEETPRVASVRASEAVQALRLDRAVFRGLLRSNPEIRRWFALPVRMHHLRQF